MLYIVYCALGVLGGYGQIVFSKPTSYDQQQTGEVNVQIHLKDVQVVALLDADILEDYTDYDYAYDYTDFTLKPIVKPTTSVSTESTTKTTTNEVESPKLNTTETEPTTIFSSEQESTTQPNELTTKITKNYENSTKFPINDNDADESLTGEKNVKIEEDEKMKTTANDANFKKTCPSRYVMDKKGRCRSLKNRRRISLVPLTMRLAPGNNERKHFSVRKDLPIRIYKSEEKL